MEQFYANAARLKKVYSVLVAKNGALIAEHYFNEKSVDHYALQQSVSKSYATAFLGLMIDRELVSSLDLKMVDLFPELAGEITDPRKQAITLEHMITMRAGYPWEESDPDIWQMLTVEYGYQNPDPLMEHIPLQDDPGTAFCYSNLMANLVTHVACRAIEGDLLEYVYDQILEPLGADSLVGYQDPDGHYYNMLHARARDMAKLGLLYLNGGEYQGQRILSKDWVQASLSSYSSNTLKDLGLNHVGEFRDWGYGYMWWAATAGDHNMVVVVTTDLFYLEHSGRSWRHEKAAIKTVAAFIAALP